MRKIILTLAMVLMCGNAWAYTDEEAKIIALQGIEELTEIENIINEGSFGSLFPVIGMGSLLNWIPYTNGKKLEETIDSLEYKIAFLRSYESQIPIASEAMREMALNSLGRLDTSTTYEYFTDTIDSLYSFLNNFLH